MIAPFHQRPSRGSTRSNIGGVPKLREGKLRVVRRRKHGLRLGLLAAVAVAAAGLSVTAYGLDLLRPLELNTVDARYRIRGTRAPPKGVVLVALDPRSLKELGVRPPLARSLHARLLDRLHADHPRLIAYDFQFIGHTSSREDRALVGSISLMLLHERLVVRPELAPAATPTRVVVGDTARPSLVAQAV